MDRRDENFREGVGLVKFVLPVLVVLTVFGLWARGVGWLSDKTFAPREEQVRHDTFKESQAYNDGMAQDLDGFYLEYQKGSAEQKAALRAVALHRLAAYPTERLPVHLQQWVRTLRNP